MDQDPGRAPELRRLDRGIRRIDEGGFGILLDHGVIPSRGPHRRDLRGGTSLEFFPETMMLPEHPIAQAFDLPLLGGDVTILQGLKPTPSLTQFEGGRRIDRHPAIFLAGIEVKSIESMEKPLQRRKRTAVAGIKHGWQSGVSNIDLEKLGQTSKMIPICVRNGDGSNLPRLLKQPGTGAITAIEQKSQVIDKIPGREKGCREAGESETMATHNKNRVFSMRRVWPRIKPCPWVELVEGNCRWLRAVQEKTRQAASRRVFR